MRLCASPHNRKRPLRRRVQLRLCRRFELQEVAARCLLELTTADSVFEAAEDKSDIRPLDERLFWWGLYVPAAAWAFLLVTAVISLKLQWLIVVGAALALSGANVVGYTKCSKEAQARLEGLSSGGAASMLGGMVSSGLASNMLGGLMGRATAPAAAPQDGFAAV